MSDRVLAYLKVAAAGAGIGILLSWYFLKEGNPVEPPLWYFGPTFVLGYAAIVLCAGVLGKAKASTLSDPIFFLSGTLVISVYAVTAKFVLCQAQRALKYFRSGRKR